MKGRLVAFAGVFCIAILIVSAANADKPPKPPKPEKTKAECIVFTGDLQSVDGGTRIEGCCPNDGPAPAYTMILDVMVFPYGTYEGYLFINVLGTPGPDQEYMVKFWTWDNEDRDPGVGDYFFEIRGGEIVRDRKAKILTVTFTDEPATVWVYDDIDPPSEISISGVSFVMVRTGDLSYCGG